MYKDVWFFYFDCVGFRGFFDKKICQMCIISEAHIFSMCKYLVSYYTNTIANKSNSELFVFVSCCDSNINFQPMFRLQKIMSFPAIKTALLWMVSSVCCACGNAKQLDGHFCLLCLW